jgi:shikimate kinase
VKRHVALIGFTASGKSTIGARLAKRLGWAFFDTDAAIVREHGPIATIFRDEGERAFRRYEQRAVQAALSRKRRSVIAVGGGAVTFGPTRALLARHAFRVFLQANATQLLARARRSRRARPLLGDKPTLASVRALYRQRLPFYREAEVLFRCRALSSRSIVRALEAHLHVERIA